MHASPGRGEERWASQRDGETATGNRPTIALSYRIRQSRRGQNGEYADDAKGDKTGGGIASKIRPTPRAALGRAGDAPHPHQVFVPDAMHGNVGDAGTNSACGGIRAAGVAAGPRHTQFYVKSSEQPRIAAMNY